MRPTRLRFKAPSQSIVLFFVLLSGCSVINPNTSRIERWREDLHYFATELPARHPNLFFAVTREEFNQAVSVLDQQIPFFEDYEVVIGIKQILALVGDSHTDVDVRFSAYPVKLERFKDGYYVTGTTVEYRRILKAKLVQIGELDVETAYSAVKKTISHDNEFWLRQQSGTYLITPAVLRALKILPQFQSGDFVFEATDGSRFPVKLNMPSKRIESTDWLDSRDPSKARPPLYLQNAEVNYWSEYLQDSRTLFFKYNRCAENVDSPFGPFAANLLDQLDKLPVDRLIIDLRHNFGGNSGILWPFIKELTKRDFINQRGKIYVITGKDTYSSAVLNAAELKTYTRAILVGEPTGSKPNLYGEFKKFNLPNSGLGIYYSTNYFKRVEGDPPSLMPDSSIEATSTDYFNGRDPVLEKILAGGIN